MEAPQSTPPLSNKRQQRRRKIIENAKSRMEKLKNMQRSPALIEEQSNDSVDPVNLVADETAMDPPDEVIPKHTPANMIQVTSPNAQTSTKTQSVSRLTLAVTAFTASRLWRLRTLLTVVCAVTVVSLETTQGVVFPGIMILLPMDCALLVYAALTHCSSQSDPNRANPLGKLSLLKVPLMVVYPVSAQWFDSVCLSALLVGHLLCDTLFMMFCIILSQCILNFV